MLREALFGSRSYALMRRALDAGAARMRTSAENIAHADTPGYRAKRVAFEELLGEAQEGGGTLARTNAGHLAPGRDAIDSIPRPRVTGVAEGGAPGAQVDLEREVVEMEKNEVHFQALSQVMADKYRALRDVIRSS